MAATTTPPPKNGVKKPMAATTAASDTKTTAAAPKSKTAEAPPKSAQSSTSSTPSVKKTTPAVKTPSKKPGLSSIKSAANAVTGAIGFNQGRKAVNEGPTTTLLSAKVWDIYTLPPNNTIKGKVVPRVINRYAHRRKISLEVHRVTPAVVPIEEDDKKEDDKKDDKAKKPEDGKAKTDEEKKADEEKPEKQHSYEECVVRVLVPVNKEVEKAAQKSGQAIRKGAKPDQAKQELQDASARATSHSNLVLNDDESTVAVDPDGALADTGGKQFLGWKAKYRVPIPSIIVKHQQKTSVFVLIEAGKIKQERELLFDSYNDARDFVQCLESERKLEEKRTDDRLQNALGDLELNKNEKLNLLVEIVSGWNLPIGDLTTSDPYVVCKMGRKELHKTKHIPSTLDPVWTIKTGSLFLMNITVKELFMNEGITCFVKDYDALGKNETLGVVAIPPKRMYTANGERMNFKVRNPPGYRGKEDVPGYIAVRVRRATEHDLQFMAGYASSAKAAQAPEHPKTKNNAIKSMVTRYQKTEKDGTKKYKVRPSPDPAHTDSIEWMSDEEVQRETMKESRHWIDAGSGSLGQLHVEILGCDDLPNLDVGGFTGNKTDTFVSLVFEDCYVRTDTIDDCLSPRWLPWTQRAFIFQIYHPSSQLFLGVFDFDTVDDHDLIGRISLDVASLRRNTEYVLTYNIYPSARVSGRKAQGTLTLRVRLEMDDQRKVVLAALEPPPPIYVNTSKRKDFRVIRSTCLGATDVDLYSMKTLTSYIDELKEYQYVMFFIQDAVITLLLWRGHFELKVSGKTYMLPIHSLTAFLFAIYLVERPQLMPSFFFASIAWMLLAVIGWKSNTKNVWAQCKTYREMAEAVALGNSTTPPHNFGPFHQYDAAKTEMEAWFKRIKASEKAAEEAALEAQLAEQERLKELEEIGDENTDISTSTGGALAAIDPIRAALFPVQQILGAVLLKLRFVKNIVTWEECYFSFWIVSACVVLSVACLFVPWFFLIRWTSRIVVWVVFGPWMKLADVYYVSKIKPETAAEKKARKAKEKQMRKLATSEAAARAREKREDAAKLKQMKKYMYGKFATKIPVLKEDRYVDRPLAQSTATPYKLKAMSLAELAMREAGYNRTRLPGQNLVGHMIPVPETESFTAAPVGKATKKPEQLSKEAPGSKQKSGAESTTVVYAKIGSAVAVAGTVTWFAVPVLAGLAEQAVGVFA